MPASKLTPTKNIYRFVPSIAITTTLSAGAHTTIPRALTTR